jgi:ATP-dependent exoDNAse (exonuclease V) alpha subunit
MAIYHLTIKPVKRGEGRAATAAAAYRAAELVADDRTGEVFDYTRKRGVEHTEIVLPATIARQDGHWARDRQELWNAAEAAEKRRDARVAREYEVAVPHELSRSQRVDLVRTFSQDLADRYGVAVDFAVHRPHREGDERNFHAHILTTTRAITPAGLGEKTALELGDKDRARLGLGPAREEITGIRARWAAFTNEALQAAEHAVRVDHRSLEAQGLDRTPTFHVGPAVTAMERRGIETEVGHRVRAEITERLQAAAELGRIEREAATLERSILELSTDIRAALAAREAARTTERTAGLTPEQLRHEAQARWLAYRQGRAREASGGTHAVAVPDTGLDRSEAAEQTPPPARIHRLDHDHSL